MTCTKLLVLAAVLALTGCGKPEQERTQTTNTAFQVDKLFVKDGCTVYRFEDYGRARYFVRCDSGQTRTEWVEPCGKNCTRPVEVPGS